MFFKEVWISAVSSSLKRAEIAASLKAEEFQIVYNPMMDRKVDKASLIENNA